MDITYFLQVLASRFVLIASKFYALAAKIQNIYLIGQYLSTPFLNIGVFFSNAALDVLDISNQWNAFYSELQTQLQNIGTDNPLIEYAQKLISFITNPKPVILKAIRALYPKIDAIHDDTYNFFKPIISQIITEITGGLQNIAETINGILSVVIPDFNTLKNNPVLWVINRLKAYSGNLANFIIDPDGWIRDRLKLLFPDIAAFLLNPVNYILDKVVDGFELKLDKYMIRLQKIIEKGISNLF